MRAIGFQTAGPVSRPDALIEIDLPVPELRPRDLLVRIKAVSVNPVDVKVRANAQPEAGMTRILGFDASGIVEAVGSDVTLFRPGDEVYYAGAINRPGTNAEFHAVDERIVGRKPKSLDFAEAAALPLTTITAWELLFNRLGLAKAPVNTTGSLLIIGAAGGVGSILTQLARKLTGLTVIGTASRPETVEWAMRMGTHATINHRKPLDEALADIGRQEVNYIAALTATATHLPVLPKIISPQGRIGIIDDPKSLDVVPFKSKAVSIHWEFMFVRPVHETPDMIEQHNLLTEVSRMVDAGEIVTTMTQKFGPMTATTLKEVHALVESGASIGKAVVEV